jgi:predicted transcriptional regulator
MFRNRVSGLPVVDPMDHLLGIITEADFLRLEVARVEDGMAQPYERVGDVMTEAVVTVDAELPLVEAAKLMCAKDLKRLPVVDDGRRLVGIISRSDIVALFTRPDEVIEDEIREDLIRRVLFVDPDVVDVGVADGVVTFVGEIGTRTEASLLEELARRLDGVVRVNSELTWRIDDTGA